MQSDADVKSQVREVLEQFNNLIFTQNQQVLAEFTPSDNALLIDSEASEIAAGRDEFEAFFARIFPCDTTFSWEWVCIEVSHAGGLAWLFADGRRFSQPRKGSENLPTGSAEC